MCVHIDGIGAKAWLAMQVRAHSATILIREKAALEEGGEWGGEEGLGGRDLPCDSWLPRPSQGPSCPSLSVTPVTE